MPMPCGLRLVVFDFDQTLSAFHVFKALAGMGDGKTAKALPVPQPFAYTELGQLRKVLELNREAFKEQNGFASAAFGGKARVEEVRQHLQRFRDHDVELVVCTKGLVGTVKKLLLDLDLLSFFTEVYGNVGDSYGQTEYDGETSDDALPPEVRKLIGSAQRHSNWASKDRLIVKLMAKRRIHKLQCVLVEDDPEEIKRAAPVCRTLFVKEAAGMTAEHFDTLHRICGDEAQPEEEAAG